MIPGSDFLKVMIQGQPDEIDKLEEDIRLLAIQFRLFFSGVRKLPPTEDRRRLEERMRDMTRGKLRDNVSRFRHATLNARYNRLQELWSRQMREREEGPIDFKQRKAALEAADADGGTPEPRRPPVTSTTLDSYVRVSSSSNGEAMNELHHLITEANQKLGKAAPTVEQVRTLVEKQAEQLRSKYGVEAIAFKVETVDGKVKLKAKPVA